MDEIGEYHCLVSSEGTGGPFQLQRAPPGEAGPPRPLATSPKPSAGMGPACSLASDRKPIQNCL